MPLCSLRLAGSPKRRTHSGVDGGHVIKVARVCRAQDGCDADRVLIARLCDLRGTRPTRCAKQGGHVPATARA